MEKQSPGSIPIVSSSEDSRQNTDTTSKTSARESQTKSASSATSVKAKTNAPTVPAEADDIQCQSCKRVKNKYDYDMEQREKYPNSTCLICIYHRPATATTTTQQQRKPQPHTKDLSSNLSWPTPAHLKPGYSELKWDPDPTKYPTLEDIGGDRVNTVGFRKDLTRGAPEVWGDADLEFL